MRLAVYVYSGKKNKNQMKKNKKRIPDWVLSNSIKKLV